MREDTKTERRDQELSELFQRYRESCPNVSPSAAFMPGIWERIEARRRSRFQLMHLSRLFLSAAAAVWLLLACILLMPSSRASAGMMRHQSYVDALAASHDVEVLGYAEVVHMEMGESNPQ